jgi:hypothetical protein
MEGFEIATFEDTSTVAPEAQERAPQAPHVDPPKPTLSQRADRLEATLKNVASKFDVDRAYKLASGLLAELDANDPGRLSDIEALYKARLAHFEAEGAQ